MILSDGCLKKSLAAGELKIEPFVADNLQPASMDCVLGDTFLFMDTQRMACVEMSKPIQYNKVQANEVVLEPHCFVLASTREKFRLPNDLTAFVEGRSSVGRMGLFIQNAGWVDPGFEGQITLELYNATRLPIRLQAGRRICQMVFCRMKTTSLRPYRGKYQGQSQATGSRVHCDVEANTNS